MQDSFDYLKSYFKLHNQVAGYVESKGQLPSGTALEKLDKKFNKYQKFYSGNIGLDNLTNLLKEYELLNESSEFLELDPRFNYFIEYVFGVLKNNKLVYITPNHLHKRKYIELYDIIKKKIYLLSADITYENKEHFLIDIQSFKIKIKNSTLAGIFLLGESYHRLGVVLRTITNQYSSKIWQLINKFYEADLCPC